LQDTADSTTTSRPDPRIFSEFNAINILHCCTNVILHTPVMSSTPFHSKLLSSVNAQVSSQKSIISPLTNPNLRLQISVKNLNTKLHC
jgi:hypothetical protein